MDQEKKIHRWTWRLGALVRECRLVQRLVNWEPGRGKSFLRRLLGEGRAALVVEHAGSAERHRRLERLRSEIQSLRAGIARRSVQEVREAVEKALNRELERLAESAAKAGKKPSGKAPAELEPPQEESNSGEAE